MVADRDFDERAAEVIFMPPRIACSSKDDLRTSPRTIGMRLLPWFMILLCLIAETSSFAETEIRPSALAGVWYPADPKNLTAQVEDFLAQARPPKLSGELQALIVPHAGYIYSGHVAAHAFSLLKNRKFETVVMIGPSHRMGFPGVSINIQDYRTPLGIVPADQALSLRIRTAGAPFVSSMPDVHAKEHCLEIQLPFLQVVLDRFRLTPMIMGSNDMSTCRALARILAEALRGRNALLLASTDLSHFHSGDQARTMDARLIKRVQRYEPELLHRDLADGRIEACGGAPLVTVMLAARLLGANRATILKYAHSGDVTGDHSRVVGYLAAAIHRDPSLPQPVADNEPPAGPDPILDPAHQRRLLSLARTAIKARLEGRPYRPPRNLPPLLENPGAAFVTLKRNGDLRGCIGRLIPDAPLASVVSEMAVRAAFHDFRFLPLTRREFDDLMIEISVLSAFQPVSDVKRVQVGKHGLLVIQGDRRGLLLPQVPGEQGWDRETFLDQTCLKAGLPAEAWRHGASLFYFTAQIFRDDSVGEE